MNVEQAARTHTQHLIRVCRVKPHPRGKIHQNRTLKNKKREREGHETIRPPNVAEGGKGEPCGDRQTCWPQLLPRDRPKAAIVRALRSSLGWPYRTSPPKLFPPSRVRACTPENVTQQGTERAIRVRQKRAAFLPPDTGRTSRAPLWGHP